MGKKLTKEEFIGKAEATHGDKYDYSQVVYAGNAAKVTIHCPEHGPFRQTPMSHMAGHGCCKCVGLARVTPEDFLARARAVHGDKYDYSQVVCAGARSQIIIGCPKHGLFQQVVKEHLSGKGCKQCAGLRVAQANTKPIGDFLARARAVHGDKYDYSQVVYQKTKAKVDIICPEHGLFRQTPECHTAGKGCNLCGFVRGANAQALSTEQFTARARAVHGDKYDYSQVVYESDKRKVDIICPEHGLFRQIAGNHIRGARCPGCGGVSRLALRVENNASCGWNKSNWVSSQKSRSARLYILECTGNGEVFYKVGITFNSIKQRFAGRRAMPYEFMALLVWQSQDAGEVWSLEKRLGKQFKHLRYKPLLPFNGQHECFSSIAEMLPHLPPDAVLCPLTPP